MNFAYLVGLELTSIRGISLEVSHQQTNGECENYFIISYSITLLLCGRTNVTLWVVPPPWSDYVVPSLKNLKPKDRPRESQNLPNY